MRIGESTLSYLDNKIKGQKIKTKLDFSRVLGLVNKITGELEC